MSITTIIIALIVFGIIVTVHEAGHFLVAKFFKVTVHEFAVGMGPKIAGKKYKETEYSLRALPLGGYVRMEGEDEDSKDPNGFNNKPVLQRMAIIFAGPFMNFLLTILILSILFSVSGVPSRFVGGTAPDMPAAEAGLIEGDEILRINGKEVRTPEQVSREIMDSQGEISVDVRRGKQILRFEMTPTVQEGRRMIGIQYANRKSSGAAIVYGFRQTFALARQMLGFLGKLVTGKMGMGGLSGPVGIISEVGKAAQTGFASVVGLAALISLNLGLINLMPIPALDGSRILFQIIELIRGKKIDPNKEGYVHMVGMICLLALMIVITYFDILKLV
ncbi:MAG: RIP metalloprotease RseP [Peptostreptococcaceae bacterium]|nr:RIP metalloprotease RseP [Peptostreptococcaceae bacterium]